MQEAKKSMKEKGIKAEDVKNLPPIKEIHGLNAPPPHVVQVNSLLKFNENDISYDKTPHQCYYEFYNYIGKQNYFIAHVMKQLEHNAHVIDRLSDLLFRIINDVKGVSKHASMVATQVEKVLKAQIDLLNELNSQKNDDVVRVMTRGGKMTQEPLYPEGHPKRIEQDSQRNNVDAPSPSKKKKKKNDRTLHASSELEVEKPPDVNLDVSISDAETQSGDEHTPGVTNEILADAQPENVREPGNDIDIELAEDLDNPPPKNKRYEKKDFVARKHGKEREPWVQKPMPFL